MDRTMQGVNTRRSRQTVASYDTYAEAQRAVDYLSDEKFSVEHVAIVAEGLRFVEQVTGRLNWGRALLNGALGGAVIGALIGLFFGLFSVINTLATALSLAFYGLLFGAVVGAIIGAVSYGFTGGRRDFTSVGGMQAERYNVMVDFEQADEAERLLEGMPAARA